MLFQKTELQMPRAQMESCKCLSVKKNEGLQHQIERVYVRVIRGYCGIILIRGGQSSWIA